MDKEDKMLLAAYVSLGAVIGGVILAVALARLVPDVVNAILLTLYLVYLVWLGDHSSRVIERARKRYRNWQEKRFYRTRMSSVIQKRIETVMRDLQTLTSGDGSIEKVAVKFFERPDFAAPESGHPLLEEVLPDFFQVRDLLLGDQRLLGLSFGYLDNLNTDLMVATRRSLYDLGEFINRYIAWVLKVVDQLGKHKGTCPSVAYANSRTQYYTFQRNFSQLMADLDSLVGAFNNAASTDPSICSEFALSPSRRVLGGFP
jgi:hypothetical protein